MNTEQILNQGTQIVIEYGPKLIGAVIVWIIGSWVIKMVTKGFGKVLDKREVDPSLKPFLKGIIDMLLKVMLGISVLGMLGIAMTSFIAILVSGFNVFPNEVEDVVSSYDKVLEVAAIGIPDERSGEVVKIFVVKKDNSLSKEELIQHCRENLTGYKVPKQIEFRKELPKTNVGKILRRALKEEITKA